MSSDSERLVLLKRQLMQAEYNINYPVSSRLILRESIRDLEEKIASRCRENAGKGE